MNSGTAWTIADGGVLRKEEVDAEAHKTDDPPKRVRVPFETEEKSAAVTKKKRKVAAKRKRIRKALPTTVMDKIAGTVNVVCVPKTSSGDDFGFGRSEPFSHNAWDK